MPSNNRDLASVWDMTQAIQNIQVFTSSLTFDEYLQDILTISAVERQFEVLGEAAPATTSSPLSCAASVASPLVNQSVPFHLDFILSVAPCWGFCFALSKM